MKVCARITVVVYHSYGFTVRVRAGVPKLVFVMRTGAPRVGIRAVR